MESPVFVIRTVSPLRSTAEITIEPDESCITAAALVLASWIGSGAAEKTPFSAVAW